MMEEELKSYASAKNVRCIMKENIMYIGNLNEENNLYYWSPLQNLDSLAFVSIDRYGEKVIPIPD